MKNLPLFLLSFLLFLLSDNFNVGAVTVEEEFDASETGPTSDLVGLLAFKSSLRDPRPPALSLWQWAPSPCNFPFVRCRRGTHRVISLSLPSSTLLLPSPLSLRGLLNLRSLRLLNLSHNLFAGPLHPSLSSALLLLPSLSRLDLSHNSLSGPLPSRLFSRCSPSLRVLSLSHNAFSGPLPSTIGACGALSTLDLSSNRLSGPLPDSILSLKRLKSLDLGGNFFEGRIPAGIGRKLVGLRVLRVSGNGFWGEVPAEVGRLKRLAVMDFSRNWFSGRIPAGFGPEMQVVDLSGNLLSGSIPVEIGNCTSLTSLLLSQNNLTGTIPLSLTNLTNLQTLDLSFNALTGSLPSDLSDLRHLRSFNVSNNRLAGPIPSGSFFDTLPFSSLSNNPDLCGSSVHRTCLSGLPKPLVLNPNSTRNPHSDPVPAISPTRQKRIILSISALVAIAAAVLIALGVVTISVLNIRARSSSPSTSLSAAPLTLSDDHDVSQSSASTDVQSGKLVMFSGHDADFPLNSRTILNKRAEIGRGGFGTVYKAELGDGRPVAIKKLSVSGLVKAQEEFARVVTRLAGIRHPNLVPLKGYYWTSSLQLLIYGYVPCGSLHRALHGLGWHERFNVILGTAKSIAHLHRHNVIHYNLKSNNVLIDGNGEPKIADYGLARLLPVLDPYVLSSKIQSGLGYTAPEFACRTVKITEKCDVYGFGVLTLEIVTGRKPVQYTEDDVVVLVDVVRGLVEEGRGEECVDGRLRGEVAAEEVAAVVKLGLICTAQMPSSRPEMREVVKILEMIRCPDHDEMSSG